MNKNLYSVIGHVLTNHNLNFESVIFINKVIPQNMDI